jgi:DnaJ-class molecular chaperone
MFMTIGSTHSFQRVALPLSSARAAAQTPHEILGLDPTADALQIRRAYHALAQEW